MGIWGFPSAGNMLEPNGAGHSSTGGMNPNTTAWHFLFNKPPVNIYIYTKSIIYSHDLIHWFNRVLHGHCQDYARLPRLSLLSSVGQLGHDDFGLAEEFVRCTDLTGPLGSGSYGGYMGAMSLGMFAKMLGLDDWIGLLIVPFCGGFAALSDLLM